MKILEKLVKSQEQELELAVLDKVNISCVKSFIISSFLAINRRR